ncbi:hypothetical protein G5I_10480 [Acromyrmex echinatior]|uniref:Uncharacterized protein n=1 Tax=Acromyrmex echinatior TaxID=103372 RepID=F4WWZ1_ACREC|nr:hypothetical protein G5I_10480 [Acromyrmex echinatior]
MYRRETRREINGMLERDSNRKARCDCWPGVKADQRERDENRRKENERAQCEGKSGEDSKELQRVKERIYDTLKRSSVNEGNSRGEMKKKMQERTRMMDDGKYAEGEMTSAERRRKEWKPRDESEGDNAPSSGQWIIKGQSESKRVKSSQSGQACSDLTRDITGRKCHANARLFCDVGKQERGRVRNKGVDRDAQVGAGGQGRLLSHISHPARKQEQASTGRLPTSPSSEIQDPSRERAAGTSHSQDTGTTVADLVWPPGGEGRTPPTTRYSASQQVSIHEVRYRPVFVSSLLRARSLLDPPF